MSINELMIWKHNFFCEFMYEGINSHLPPKTVFYSISIWNHINKVCYEVIHSIFHCIWNCGLSLSEYNFNQLTKMDFSWYDSTLWRHWGCNEFLNYFMAWYGKILQIHIMKQIWGQVLWNTYMHSIYEIIVQMFLHVWFYL
jgi:hypothetical protein